jgi:hypothetical protein
VPLLYNKIKIVIVLHKKAKIDKASKIFYGRLVNDFFFTGIPLHAPLLPAYARTTSTYLRTHQHYYLRYYGKIVVKAYGRIMNTALSLNLAAL